MFSIIIELFLLAFFVKTSLGQMMPETNSTADAHLDVSCKSFTQLQHCIKLGTKFYVINPNHKLNWFQADRYCRQQNARLALIEDDAEMDVIANFIDEFHNMGVYAFWLGANQLSSEGTFYEVETGLPLRYARWGFGLPDNYNGPEDCLNLIWWEKNNKYIMNDDNCKFVRHFICEFSVKCTYYN